MNSRWVLIQAASSQRWGAAFVHAEVVLYAPRNEVEEQALEQLISLAETWELSTALALKHELVEDMGEVQAHPITFLLGVSFEFRSSSKPHHSGISVACGTCCSYARCTYGQRQGAAGAR